MRIAMVAGEASGDMLAAHLIRALREKVPEASFFGIGGPKMQAEGFEAWWPAEKLSVMGYVDALKRLPELFRIRRGLLSRVREADPDLFIGVDAPDFNLGVEKRLRASGIKTLHYVSPSIWAWRGSRVHKIGRAADQVMCLFPFEPPLYEKNGIRATYVGHPLADVFPDRVNREEIREGLRIPAEQTVVAVLPGSREGEVGRLSASLVGMIKLLAEKRPDTLFLVPFVTRKTREIFEQALAEGEANHLPVRLLFGHAHEAMAAADVVVVASGTASLEAALLKRPMLIVYKVGKMTYRLAKRLVYLPWVGLPNILAGESLVPELIQDEANPEAMAAGVSRWLEDAEACKHVVARFDQLHEQLRQGNSARAASVVLSMARH